MPYKNQTDIFHVVLFCRSSYPQVGHSSSMMISDTHPSSVNSRPQTEVHPDDSPTHSCLKTPSPAHHYSPSPPASIAAMATVAGVVTTAANEAKRIPPTNVASTTITVTSTINSANPACRNRRLACEHGMI